MTSARFILWALIWSALGGMATHAMTGDPGQIAAMVVYGISGALAWETSR